jgi:hypothetical protein
MPTRPEQPGDSAAEWVPLSELPTLPLWPKELRIVGRRLLQGQCPEGSVSVVALLESPWATAEQDPFA